MKPSSSTALASVAGNNVIHNSRGTFGAIGTGNNASAGDPMTPGTLPRVRAALIWASVATLVVMLPAVAFALFYKPMFVFGPPIGFSDLLPVAGIVEAMVFLVAFAAMTWRRRGKRVPT